MAIDKQTSLEEAESRNPALLPLSILRTLWKRKIRIVLTWVLLAGIGAAVVRMLPAVYLSEAVVLIDTQKIPEKFVSSTVASDLDDRIAAIRQMLLSGGELKKIIDDFGLYKDERKSHFEEEILEMMRKDISITLESADYGVTPDSLKSNSKRAAAFRIGYQGSDPVTVMRVANRLTDLYVEQNLKTREGEAEGTSEFLDTQLREAKKQLDSLEAAVSAYKLRHNGELPQQEESLGNTLSRLQTVLEANRDAINRALQTRVILEGNLNAMEVTLTAQQHDWELTQRQTEADDPIASAGQPPAAPKKKQTTILQEQLDLLRMRYSDSHPDVIRMQAELARVRREEARLETETSPDALDNMPPKNGANRSRSLASVREPFELTHTREQVAELKAQIRAVDKESEDRKAQQQRILNELDQYQARLERLPVREQEMAQITRDYEMAKDNYKSLLDKKMAAEMALDMERRQQSERFIVLDRAQLPEKPTKPKRPLLYSVSAGLALALALVLGFAAELRQNVVLGEWELPADTPVLARLPEIRVKGSSRSTKMPLKKPQLPGAKTLIHPSATSMLILGATNVYLQLFIHRL